MNEFNKHGTFPEGGTAPPIAPPCSESRRWSTWSSSPAPQGQRGSTKDSGSWEGTTHYLQFRRGPVGQRGYILGSVLLDGGRTRECDTNHMPLVPNTGCRPAVLQGIQGRDAIGVWHVHPQCLPCPWLSRKESWSSGLLGVGVRAFLIFP